MRVRTFGLCFVVAATAGSMALHVGCSTSSPVTPTGDAGGDAAGNGPIIIGVSNSLTGGLAGIGTPLSNSVKVAQQYINSSGGILGRQVSFVIQDDGSDEQGSPDQGAKVTKNINDLLNLGAVAIIGPNGSGQVSTVQNLLFTKQVIQLSATATSPLLTTAQPPTQRFFFRTVPPDNFQGKAVAKFVALGPNGTTACNKLALFYYTNPYGSEMAKVIKDPAQSGFNGTIVADVTTDTSVKSDYSAEVGTIVAAKPDCLAMIIYDDVADAFMTAFKAATTPAPAGWNPNFFVTGTDGVYTNDFLVNGRINKADPASPTAAEGVYGTNPDTNPLTTDYNDFKNLYTAQFPLPSGQTDIDPYAANQFDAAILAALAIQAAGTTTDKIKIRDSLFAITGASNPSYGPGKLVDAIQALKAGNPIHYTGASGNLVFDQNGNVLSGYIVWHVKNGQFETVSRFKSSDLK